MIILNFAHPITDAQRVQIAALAGIDVAEITVVNAPSQIDPNQPIVDQIKQLFAAGIAAVRDQAPDADPRALVVNLPGLAPSAAVLTTLWALTYGQFPTVLRLRSVSGPVTVFEVAEIVDLNMIATSGT